MSVHADFNRIQLTAMLQKLAGGKNLYINKEGQLDSTQTRSEDLRLKFSGVIHSTSPTLSPEAAQRYVELKLMQAFCAYENSFQSEDFELVKKIAEKAGLFLNNPQSVTEHFHLRLVVGEIFNRIIQQNNNQADRLGTVIDKFKEIYGFAAAPYAKVIGPENAPMFVSEEDEEEGQNNNSMGTGTGAEAEARDDLPHEEAPTVSIKEPVPQEELPVAEDLSLYLAIPDVVNASGVVASVGTDHIETTTTTISADGTTSAPKEVVSVSQAPGRNHWFQKHLTIRNLALAAMGTAAAATTVYAVYTRLFSVQGPLLNPPLNTDTCGLNASMSPIIPSLGRCVADFTGYVSALIKNGEQNALLQCPHVGTAVGFLAPATGFGEVLPQSVLNLVEWFQKPLVDQAIQLVSTGGILRSIMDHQNRISSRAPSQRTPQPTCGLQRPAEIGTVAQGPIYSLATPAMQLKEVPQRVEETKDINEDYIQAGERRPVCVLTYKRDFSQSAVKNGSVSSSHALSGQNPLPRSHVEAIDQNQEASGIHATQSWYVAFKLLAFAGVLGLIRHFQKQKTAEATRPMPESAPQGRTGEVDSASSTVGSSRESVRSNQDSGNGTNPLSSSVETSSEPESDASVVLGEPRLLIDDDSSVRKISEHIDELNRIKTEIESVSTARLDVVRLNVASRLGHMKGLLNYHKNLAVLGFNTELESIEGSFDGLPSLVATIEERKEQISLLQGIDSQLTDLESRVQAELKKIEEAAMLTTRSSTLTLPSPRKNIQALSPERAAKSEKRSIAIGLSGGIHSLNEKFRAAQRYLSPEAIKGFYQDMDACQKEFDALPRNPIKWDAAALASATELLKGIKESIKQLEEEKEKFTDLLAKSNTLKKSISVFLKRLNGLNINEPQKKEALEKFNGRFDELKKLEGDSFSTIEALVKSLEDLKIDVVTAFASSRSVVWDPEVISPKKQPKEVQGRPATSESTTVEREDGDIEIKSAQWFDMYMFFLAIQEQFSELSKQGVVDQDFETFKINFDGWVVSVSKTKCNKFNNKYYPNRTEYNKYKTDLGGLAEKLSEILKKRQKEQAVGSQQLSGKKEKPSLLTLRDLLSAFLKKQELSALELGDLRKQLTDEELKLRKHIEYILSFGNLDKEDSEVRLLSNFLLTDYFNDDSFKSSSNLRAKVSEFAKLEEIVRKKMEDVKQAREAIRREQEAQRLRSPRTPVRSGNSSSTGTPVTVVRVKRDPATVPALQGVPPLDLSTVS